jgi:hypothetical protein
MSTHRYQLTASCIAAHAFSIPLLRGSDGEEMPFAGHTFQLVSAALLEHQS